VRQVLVERRARGHAGLLQLDDHQRQAVDEADQIRSADVERAGDAELADQQEIVVPRLLPINHAQPGHYTTSPFVSRSNVPVAPKVSSNADTVVQPSSANNPMAGRSTSWSSV